MTKNQTPLTDLFNQGKTKQKWKGVSSCAKVITLDRASLNRYLVLEADDKLANLTRRERVYYLKLLAAMQEALSTGPPPDTQQDAIPPGRGDPSVPDDVIASPYYDRLLAGVAEFNDQILGGVRFVLTERNFKRLHGVVTKQEIADTRLLIQELRRRLTLVTQNDDEQVRALCFSELGTELNELLLAAQLAQEVVPTKAVAQLEQLRKKL